MEHAPISADQIRAFESRLKNLGRQPATVESYVRDCSSFLDFLEREAIDTRDVSPATLSAFQNYLQEKGIKENSLRRTVIGVRQFFRFLQDHLKWDYNPFDESVIPARQQTTKFRVSTQHVEAMLQHARNQPSRLKSLRDQCLIMLLAHEGIKATEVIQLLWYDFMYQSSGGRLRIDGDRPRHLSIEPDTAKALIDFRNLMGQSENHKDQSASRSHIMIGFKGTDAKFWEKSLTRHGVKFALYELGDEVGVSHLNSEELRHYAMKHKIELGWEPEQIMNHFGLRTLGNIALHLPQEDSSF
jgi:integrase/recombinase XerD